MTIDQDVKKYMEENMTDDSAGEFLLNKGVQNHIQINLFEPLVKDGNDPDWDKTKYNLAKKGMEEKDVCIGDMDYINKVGIAATGFRPKKAQPGYNDDVERFMYENMTHISAEEYFSNKGAEDGTKPDKVQNYIQISLFEPLVKDGDDPDWNQTRLNLAKKAMKEKYGCACVAHMDYINKVGIAATGFRLKEAQPGYNDDVERFMYENMTHISAEEYFSNKGAEDGTKPDKVQNYKKRKLFEPLVKDGNNPDWDKTRLNLARNAMKGKYGCVAYMDYKENNGIEAKGLKPK